ncbi:MAG TPA: WD40 repeat domain-containing protein [Gemmataceae bacterium]|jgi:WD40 repeat protein
MTAAPDPTKAKLDRQLKHASPLIGCRFDPFGRFLFATAQDCTLQRFDLVTGAKVAFAGHASWVRGLAFVPQADELAAHLTVRSELLGLAGGWGALVAPPKPLPFTVVSGDYHGRLIWWPGEASEPRPIRHVEAHDGWVRAVAASPDGRLIASCGNDGLVKLWSAADGSHVRTLEGHGCHVYNLAFHPGGERLVSADLLGIVKDWDWQTGELVRDLDARPLHKYDAGFRADIGGARGLAFAPDGSRLAVCGITNVSNAFAGVGNPLVIAFNWADGKPTQLTPKAGVQGTAWGVALHPLGLVIAAGGGAGAWVWFWKGDAAASAHVVALPASGRDLALHPSGERFAVAGANGTAYVYALPPA